MQRLTELQRARVLLHTWLLDRLWLKGFLAYKEQAVVRHHLTLSCHIKHTHTIYTAYCHSQ